MVRDQAEWRSQVGAEWGPLTPRQSQVAWLVARGWTDRAIARSLRVTEGAVAEIGRRARRRLGCDGRVALAAWVAAEPARWTAFALDEHGMPSPRTSQPAGTAPRPPP
jgi:DNA-binding NarL/FixJ family response regulator